MVIMGVYAFWLRWLKLWVLKDQDQGNLFMILVHFFMITLFKIKIEWFSRSGTLFNIMIAFLKMTIFKVKVVFSRSPALFNWGVGFWLFLFRRVLSFSWSWHIFSRLRRWSFLFFVNTFKKINLSLFWFRRELFFWG